MRDTTTAEIERQRRLERQSRVRARVARQPDAYRPMSKAELQRYLLEIHAR